MMAELEHLSPSGATKRPPRTARSDDISAQESGAKKQSENASESFWVRLLQAGANGVHTL
jgi:hypothetical protein